MVAEPVLRDRRFTKKLRNPGRRSTVMKLDSEILALPMKLPEGRTIRVLLRECELPCER